MTSHTWAELAADTAAREAQATADKAAREAAEAASRRASLEGALRERFLQAGGTLQEFEAAKPGLIADHLRAETLSRETEEKLQTTQRYARG